MKCPHCIVDFHDSWTDHWITWPGNNSLIDEHGHWHILATRCPACQRAILRLQTTDGNNKLTGMGNIQVWPKGIARAPLPTEVPEPYAKDYREACNTLPESPNASAALSRRCLQRLLREKAGAKPSNLYNEIGAVIEGRTLPTHLAEAVDAIRQIGKFGAHPNKSTNTGEIIDVEPGEAEWCLDVLEGLFDFYFVQPAKLAAKKAALNQKLGEAGQRPMKVGTCAVIPPERPTSSRLMRTGVITAGQRGYIVHPGAGRRLSSGCASCMIFLQSLPLPPPPRSKEQN